MCKDFYILNFITKEDFEKHTLETIRHYQEILKSIDLKTFNQNIIDPIKLLFDKNIFNNDYEKIIEFELHRQRDKSNNNAIGYFHQKIFQYISNCTVPKNGWDIIFEDRKKTYYIEMKNKHNTMNSSSSSKTYMKMQNHLLADNKNSICALVEVIAKKSQNIPWIISIDGIKQKEIENLRRISIDKFYALVTNDANAFSKICIQLSHTIPKLLTHNQQYTMEKDTVMEDLQKLDSDIQVALFKLAFSTYEGFSNFSFD